MLSPPITSPTEQAEKDQHADQVARGLARLVEARGDAVEQGPQRGRRQADLAALAGAEHPRHRAEQARRRAGRRGQVAVGEALAEALDPFALGVEREHLAEDVDDAGEKNAEDHPVDRRVAHEGGFERAVERRRQRRDQDQEQHHAHDEAVRPADPPPRLAPNRVGDPFAHRVASASVSSGSAPRGAGGGR
jgi:hypothetical protein